MKRPQISLKHHEKTQVLLIYCKTNANFAKILRSNRYFRQKGRKYYYLIKFSFCNFSRKKPTSLVKRQQINEYYVIRLIIKNYAFCLTDEINGYFVNRPTNFVKYHKITANFVKESQNDCEFRHKKGGITP